MVFVTSSLARSRFAETEQLENRTVFAPRGNKKFRVSWDCLVLTWVMGRGYLTDKLRVACDSTFGTDDLSKMCMLDLFWVTSLFLRSVLSTDDSLRPPYEQTLTG